MRVYILTDMEGTAGVESFADCARDGFGYREGRRLTTLEVNAAVEGALDAGASEIVVFDGHGAGAIDAGLLHAAAQLLHGRPLRWPFLLDGGYDALILTGHHAMSETPEAHLCHTWSSKSIERVWLNGREIGEIGVNATVAGLFGIPTVMVSGDAAAVSEAEAFIPGVSGVVVKKGISIGAALTRSPAWAREAIRAGARRGLERRGEIAPLQLASPYELRIQYRSPLGQRAEPLPPGEERPDERTRVLRGDDLPGVLNSQ